MSTFAVKVRRIAVHAHANADQIVVQHRMMMDQSDGSAYAWQRVDWSEDWEPTRRA